MSDLTDLKKVIEGNSKAISALIQAESNSDRIKLEIASNQRILEGLHEKIKAAEGELEAIKQEGTRTVSDAQRKAEDLLNDANLAKAQASQSKLESSRLERLAQDRSDEAQGLKTQYEAALAEVTAQKEKLKAALV